MVSRVQTSSFAQAGGGTTATPSLTSVTSGNLVVVVAFGYKNGGGAAILPTSLTDNQGNTLTRRAGPSAIDLGGWDAEEAVYELILPAGYATYSATVTITSAGAGWSVSAVMAEYSGVTATSEFDQAAAATSGSAGITTFTVGPTATNTADTTLAIGVIQGSNGAAGSLGFSQTGGANWPTGTGGSSSTGGQLALQQVGNTADAPGGVWDSITTAWQSATTSDTWGISAGSNETSGVLATFKATSGPPPQYARPDADVSVGTWTTDSGATTNLFQAIDETPASDTDYIQSVTDPSAAAETTGLGDVTDPVSSTGHIVRYRVART